MIRSFPHTMLKALYSLRTAVQTILVLLLSTFFLGTVFYGGGEAIALSNPASIAPSITLAYNIDMDMDKAREETTVDHYGEGIRDIVQSANENNVNNPDSKATAQSSYEREGVLEDKLPEVLGKDKLPKQIGEGFSQKELENMEK